jgi:hypothetical protein
LLRPIQQLAIELNRRDRLQAEDRDRTLSLLRQAADAIHAGESPATPQAHLAAASQAAADARTQANTFLQDVLASSLAEAQSLVPHIKLTKNL